MAETKYTGYISCYNNAGARFEFSANGINKAVEYIESLFTGDTTGFDWDRYPGQIHYISFKSETAKHDRYIYTKEPYCPDKYPVKSFAQCIKENFDLKKQNEVLLAAMLKIRSAYDWVHDLAGQVSNEAVKEYDKLYNHSGEALNNH